MHAAKKRPKSLRPGRGQNVHGQAVAAIQIVSKDSSRADKRNIGMMKQSLSQIQKAMVDYPWNKIIVKQYFEYKNKIRIKQIN